MYSAIQIVSPPATPLISVGLLRRHTRITQTSDDDLLQFYIDSAIQQAQNYLNRALITQTITYRYAATQPPVQWPMATAPIAVFPLGLTWILQHQDMHTIDLIRSPVQAVTGITFSQWGGADQTLVQGDDFDVDLALDPGRVHLRSGTNWQSNNHLAITYRAGYGDNPSDVPAPIRHAVAIMAAQLYESRGDTDFALSCPAKRLLDDYRQQVFPSAF